MCESVNSKQTQHIHTYFLGLPWSPRPPLLGLRGARGLLGARALPGLVPASAHGSWCCNSAVVPVNIKEL